MQGKFTPAYYLPNITKLGSMLVYQTRIKKSIQAMSSRYHHGIEIRKFCPLMLVHPQTKASFYPYWYKYWYGNVGFWRFYKLYYIKVDVWRHVFSVLSHGLWEGRIVVMSVKKGKCRHEFLFVFPSMCVSAFICLYWSSMCVSVFVTVSHFSFYLSLDVCLSVCGGWSCVCFIASA